MPSLSEIASYMHKVLNFPLIPIGQNSTLTLASIMIFLGILVGFYILSKVINRLVLRKILAQTKLDQGVQFTLRRITRYLMMIVGALIAFQFIGVDLNGIVVIFGFLSVGIGFGLQNLTSNFISGVILLFERPIKVGDRVTVGQVEGDVTEINIRSTTIRSLNNISIIVPNSEFVSSSVTNWSHGDLKIRVDIDVGVSYNSDLDTVLNCLNEVAIENKEVLKNPAPDTLFVNFGDSSWNLRLRVWISNPKRHPQVRSELNCAIVRKFREHNVEIPFPQRDLHIKSNDSILNAKKVQ